MKHFIIILLLSIVISCSPKIIGSNNSYIIVTDRKNSVIAHNTTLLVKEKAILRFIFHPYDSEGLCPKVYAAGHGKIDYTHNPPARIKPSVFYEIECVPEHELIMLFIFEGDDRYGHKILIRILKIK